MFSNFNGSNFISHNQFLVGWLRLILFFLWRRSFRDGRDGKFVCGRKSMRGNELRDGGKVGLHSAGKKNSGLSVSTGKRAHWQEDGISKLAQGLRRLWLEAPNGINKKCRQRA